MFLSAPDHFSLGTQLFSSNQAAELVGVHLVVNWYAWFVVICSHLEGFLIKLQIQLKSSHKVNSRQTDHTYFCTTNLVLRHLRSEMHFILTKARKDAQGVVLAFFLTNVFRSLSSKFVLWDAKSSFEVVFKSFS